jgi:hypothetical protein
MQEKIVKAQQLLETKLIDLINKTVEKNPMTTNKEEIINNIKALKNSKEEVEVKSIAGKLNQAFQAPPQTQRHEYAHIQSLIREYAEIKKLDLQNNSPNNNSPSDATNATIHVWQSKDKYEAKTPEQILEHRAGSKNFMERMGESIRHFGEKMINRFNPEKLKEIKQVHRTRELGLSDTLSLNLPQSPKPK